MMPLILRQHTNNSENTDLGIKLAMIYLLKPLSGQRLYLVLLLSVGKCEIQSIWMPSQQNKTLTNGRNGAADTGFLFTCFFIQILCYNL